MRININTSIIGQNVILVPYREYHVPRYHKWMKSEELQKLTASEPLTLQEEYEMQISWQNDNDKCTFIILDKCLFNKTSNEVESMIGDTNIFITDKDNAVGEIEIMIAEPVARGKRFGWESVTLMLLYGINFLKIGRFEAKISLNNTISIKMFMKFGFEEKSRSDFFKEVTLEKKVCDEWTKWLSEQTCFEIQTY